MELIIVAVWRREKGEEGREVEVSLYMLEKKKCGKHATCRTCPPGLCKFSLQASSFWFSIWQSSLFYTSNRHLRSTIVCRESCGPAWAIGGEAVSDHGTQPRQHWVMKECACVFMCVYMCVCGREGETEERG